MGYTVELALCCVVKWSLLQIRAISITKLNVALKVVCIRSPNSLKLLLRTGLELVVRG